MTTDGTPAARLLPGAGMPGADLPVAAVLPDVVAAVRTHGVAVLVAPPGSGKTSLLPLALADVCEHRVVVAEPRRIATRAAANRMAQLLGEETWRRIGYSVRGDRRVSGSTRVEVVTTGLLLRRLQADPELPGVDAIVIDEVHERHLDADMALAYCLDVRANLRPDLLLVGTSATPDTARLRSLLGGDAPAPLVSADTRTHPVAVVFAPPPRPIPLLPGHRVDPRFLDHVASVVRRSLTDREGDVLVFLPGEFEIRQVASRLSDIPDVLGLYGRQSAADQDRALRASPGRRVVLSTAVAESSLTVPGVRIVVDSGLAREPRMDHARGLGTLITTRVSLSTATQRAGRAGRQWPGTVYRCWSEAEESYLDAHPEPEIRTADLTGFALSVADWGHPGGAGLALMDPPPEVSLTAASTVLSALGAVDEQGRITSRGHLLAKVGTHPRLARALLDGAAVVGRARAAEVVALLSDDGSSSRTDDLPAQLRDLRTGRDRPAAAAWREGVRRLTAESGSIGPADRDGPPGHRWPGGDISGGTGGDIGDDIGTGIVVALAFPERIARLRDPSDSGGRNYLMSSGTGAQLGPSTVLTGLPWIAIAVADRPSGRADARIRSASPLDADTALWLGASSIVTDREIVWRGGSLHMRQRRRLGAIVLADNPLSDADPAGVAAAVAEGLRTDGLSALRWSSAADLLRRRMALLHASLGAPWPDMSETALLASLDTWLAPDLQRVRTQADLRAIDLERGIRRLLPWPAASRLAELAPERVEVPSGSSVRVDYSAVDADGLGSPVLPVRIQETFGWIDAPRMADGRVRIVLHLLSPAGRPAAITSDLASFWRQGYPQVRSELRSRYPRHAWPEDPMSAQPVRRPPRRPGPDR